MWPGDKLECTSPLPSDTCDRFHPPRVQEKQKKKKKKRRSASIYCTSHRDESASAVEEVLGAKKSCHLVPFGPSSKVMVTSSGGSGSLSSIFGCLPVVTR